MFMCAGNLNPENFPGYLGFLKGLEYRKGIPEWIAHSFYVACCGYFGITSTRDPGAEKRKWHWVFSPCYSFSGSWYCQGNCRKESFPNAEHLSAEVRVGEALSFF